MLNIHRYSRHRKIMMSDLAISICNNSFLVLNSIVGARLFIDGGLPQRGMGTAIVPFGTQEHVPRRFPPVLCVGCDTQLQLFILEYGPASSCKDTGMQYFSSSAMSAFNIAWSLK